MAGIQRREYARLLVVPFAFGLSTFFLWCLFSSRPPLNDGHTPDLHFPKSLDDLRELVRVSSAYKTDHWYFVLLLFSSAYIYKQTFAIPGSALLNLLGGALFGSLPFGFPLCCILTAIGASNCFLLSRLVGKSLVQKKLASKIQWLQEKIHENENQLFLFLVSLRVFPMTPNWLLNVTAPYVDIPLPIFSLSVFFGLIPYNFLCVQAGGMLADIQSMEDIFTPRCMLGLMTLALVMFTFSHFARKRKQRHSD